jgi:hypothetical protein
VKGQRKGHKTRREPDLSLIKYQKTPHFQREKTSYFFAPLFSNYRASKRCKYLFKNITPTPPSPLGGGGVRVGGEDFPGSKILSR